MPIYEEYADAREAWLQRTDPKIKPVHNPGRLSGEMEDVTPFDKRAIARKINRAIEQYHPTPQRIAQEWANLAKEYAEQQLSGVPLPESADVLTRFPGIDPTGKLCEADMGFAQREQRLRNVLQLRSPELRALTNQMLSPETNEDMIQKMRSDCFLVRRAERAAKLCQHPDGSQLLVQDRQRMLQGKGIQTYDAMLTGLEQLAGLKAGEPSPETKAAFREAGKPVFDGPYADLMKPGQMPASLDINCQNFEGIARQSYFGNPANWGKDVANMPKDLIASPASQRMMSNYVTATVNDHLDTFFNPVEAGGKMAGDRNDLITIEGRTVREILKDQFTKSHGPNARYTQEQYQAEYKQRCAELVFTGLSTGKRVEAFIPDATGRLPKEPVQITKSGYEPSPLTPVILNGFERFCSKMGMFKEKAAKAERYQRIMDGRQRVMNGQWSRQYALRNEDALRQYRQQNPGPSKEEALAAQKAKFDRLNLMKRNLSPGTPAMRRLFYQGFEAENFPIETAKAGDGAFRLSRTEPISTCMGMLAAQGHSIQDIVNPERLGPERDAAMKLYMEKAMAGDKAWLAQTVLQGRKALIEQADNYMRGTNLTKWDNLLDKMPVLNSIRDALVDHRQIADMIHPELDPLVGPQGETWVNLSNRASCVETISNDLEQSVTARVNLLAERPQQPEFARNLASAIMESHYDNALFHASQGADFSKMLNGEELQRLKDSLLQSDTLNDVVAEMSNPTSNLPKVLGDRLATGELRKNLLVERGTNEFGEPALSTPHLRDTLQPTKEEALHLDVKRLNLMNNIGKFARELFFQEHIRQHEGRFEFTGNFHAAARTSAVGTCIGHLLAEGHSIPDILDPTKLKNERAEIGRTYVQKEAQNDKQWLARESYFGEKAAVAAMEQYSQQIDFSNEAQLRQHLPYLQSISLSAFDTSQAVNKDNVLKAAYYEAARQDMPGANDKTIDMVDNRVNNIANYISTITGGVTAQDRLARVTPVTADGPQIAHDASLILQSKISRQMMKESLTNHPERSICDRVSWLSLGSIIPQIAPSALAQQVNHLTITRSPLYLANMAHDFANGKILEQCKLTPTLNNGMLDLTIESPNISRMVENPPIAEAPYQMPQINPQAAPAPQMQASQMQAAAPVQPMAQPPQAPQMGGRGM